MNTNTYAHNDVTLTTADNSRTFTHNENKFPAFVPTAEEEITCTHELYSTSKHGIKVLLHLRYLAYIIVNPQGIVIGKEIQSYDEAIKKAEKIDDNYAHWLVEHTYKGMPKSKFVKEVNERKLQAKLVFCGMNGRTFNTEFHRLVKRKGFGSVDIYREGNGYSALFYINDMTAARMVYTGTELLIYSSGFRVYNEQEKAVLAEWESIRDPKAEWLDAMTDGSTEYWRKKCFFEEKGCGHLMAINYKGLVREETLRGELSLKYEIRKV